MFIPNLLSADSGGVISLPTRIAIVEDEPDLRDAGAEYLGANGYEVVAAENADAMRELVKTETFHLAILDIAMPGEDGLSLGRWLRHRAWILNEVPGDHGSSPGAMIFATGAVPVAAGRRT